MSEDGKALLRVPVQDAPDGTAHTDNPHAAAAAAAADYELGKLNRHWYRRCLDRLDEDLRRSGAYPSVEDLKRLCDRVLTGFLAAVTGQAPFSERLQFPADRAYFIPFEGDNAERFNFAKPFYRLLSGPDRLAADEFKDSIWSFCPWTPRGADLRIVSSSDEKQFTVSFEGMISVREASTVEDQGDAAAPGTPLLRLKKALFLRSHYEDLLRQAIWPRDDEGKEGAARAFRGRLDAALDDALVALFGIYRETPGNAAIELLLRNHLHVLDYLFALVPSDPSDALSEETLKRRREAERTGQALASLGPGTHRDLFARLLRASFLKKPAAAASRQAAPLLETFFKGILEDQPLYRDDRTGAAWYDADVLKLLAAEDDTIQTSLDTIVRDLRSFRKEFLNQDREEELESILAELLGDQSLRAGETKQSFVWVCPDFESLWTSLPDRYQELAGADRVVKVQKYSQALTRPYVEFFRRLDVVSVEKETCKRALDAYWQTRAQGDRKRKIFASADGPTVGLALPEEAIDPVRPFGADSQGKEAGAWSAFADPRPQNIFLRVCIRDSLNEPVINGLFVFSTDYDEGRSTNKTRERRFEDVEDLLAFAKVYFFAVREFFRGLDLARKAREIGELNQHLYDKRLSGLDVLMRDRILTFDKKSVTDDECWGKFIYEVLNNYAYSLSSTTRRTRMETFPYDRLLIVPLAARTEVKEYDLPFYLFQAIFVERTNGLIHPERYSLLKPYQSPAEEVETVSADGQFTMRSFQQEYADNDGKIVALDRYLEKHYVGAEPQPGGGSAAPAAGARTAVEKEAPAQEPMESCVIKAVSGPGEMRDRGQRWVGSVLHRFWEKTRPGARGGTTETLWIDFLTRLTRDFARVRAQKALTADNRIDHHWFWLRLGLLRVTLKHVQDPKDDAFQIIRDQYDEALKLEFDADQRLNILACAGQREDQLFDTLQRSLHNPTDDALMQFVPYRLSEEDPFVLAFLEVLTEQVVDASRNAADAPATWFQPLLTRPLEAPLRRSLEEEEQKEQKAADATPAQRGSEERRLAEADLSRWAGGSQTVGDRKPQYESIRNGSDEVRMFLGVIHAQVSGGNEREKRRLSYLVAMIRDFKETGKNRFQADEAESREQEEIDLRDLALYTATFFRTVKNTVDKTVKEQQLGVFARDISQIARNWYSSGIDDVVAALQAELQALVAAADSKNDLGRLRPEVVDCFFDELFKVLVRREKRADNKTINLESFPFDRVLHIPLWGEPSEQPSDAARLCYARATVVNGKDSDAKGKVDWQPQNAEGKADGKTPGEATYAVILDRGRVWDAKGGLKEKARATCTLGPRPPARGTDPWAKLFRAAAPGPGSANPASRETDPGPDPVGAAAAAAPGPGSANPASRETDPGPNQVGAAAAAAPGPGSANPASRETDPGPNRVGAAAAEGSQTTLGKALLTLAREDAFMDHLVPRLYEARPLQALAQAGLLCHLLQRLSLTAAATDQPGLRRAALRLWKLLEDRIRSLERQERARPMPVQTAADVQRVTLRPWPQMDQGVRPASADLLGFREFFEAVEGLDWVYGLAGMPKSKVFLVYYSLQAPDRFKEALGNDPRYRGVLCLIVDDARSDPKEKDQETVDQEDLHTFVHNAVNGLKLVLDLQALLDQVHQPGAEQSIIGTLHRLKNDLGKPLITLRSVKDVLEPLVRDETAGNGSHPPRALTAEKARELYEKIEEAETTITGIEGLFRQLKEVSAVEQGSLFLETLSSDWLGWLFASKLCAAAGPVLDSLIPKGTPGNAAREIAEARSEIDAVARIAARRFNPKEDWSDLASPPFAEPEKVQRELLRLQTALERAFRAHAGGKAFEVFFSYQVFAPQRLYFQGSEMLVEALNILIENAFQAFCGCVTRADGDGKGRLSLVCRPAARKPADDRGPGEVLLEIRNSSLKISEEVYKHLVAPIAMPMTAQVHAKGSGKKGGSGFGHYYARRVIASFCGGQERRRQLKVTVDQVNEEGLACVRVNLLEPDPTPQPRAYSRAEIRKLVQEVFAEAARLPEVTAADGKQQFAFPSDAPLGDFLQVAKGLLTAAREDVIDTMFRELQNAVAAEIKDNTQRFREQLSLTCARRAAALATSAAAPQRERLGQMVRELADERQVPRESFQALREWLRQHNVEDRALLQELAEGDDTLWAPPDVEPGETAVDAGSRERLRHFLANGWPAPGDLFAIEERARLQAELAPFTPHLRRPANTEEGFADCLRKTFDSDSAGRTVPVRERVVAEFKPPCWSLREDPGAECLLLTFRLSAAAAEPSAAAPRLTEVVAEQALRKYFTANLIGRKFLKWRRAMQALNAKNAPGTRLEFERFPPRGEEARPDDVPHWEVRLVLQALPRAEGAGGVAPRGKEEG